MDPDTFNEILERITPRIKKLTTNYKKPYKNPWLAATLRFLATENSSKCISYSFRVSHNIACDFFIEVCQAIIDEYADKVIVKPATPDGWKEVADDIWKRWNFPHCLGGHRWEACSSETPEEVSSLFHNYKGFFPIFLLAIVDSDYKFMYVDVGQSGIHYLSYKLHYVPSSTADSACPSGAGTYMFRITIRLMRLKRKRYSYGLDVMHTLRPMRGRLLIRTQRTAEH